MTDFSPLAGRTAGRLLLPGDDGFEAAVSGFNTVVHNRPEAVLVAASADDVVEAVRFARAGHLPVHVLSTGHGAEEPVTDGLLVSVRELDGVEIDPGERTATFGGGVIWAEVVTAAAEYGLAPVTGSSTGVGAVGFMLGGGLSPFARAFGFASDRLVTMQVVTGEGELVTVSAEENADLFWALRGGKGGLGVVTEATVELVEMPVFYGGALFFDIEHVGAVLDGWLGWTATAEGRTTTSLSVLRFPGADDVPPPFRGRHLVSLRFARPGSAAEGEPLAAPLRTLAPVYLDDVAERPATEVARIHNDPDGPLPAWTRGAMLTHPDAAFAAALVPVLTSDAPFLGIELRHIGGATEIDVPETSAVGGRENDWAFTAIGLPEPSLFAEVLPAAYAALHGTIAPWVAPSTTINWLVQANDPAQFATAWPRHILARLSEVRAEYDPDGILPYAPVP